MTTETLRRCRPRVVAGGVAVLFDSAHGAEARAAAPARGLPTDERGEEVAPTGGDRVANGSGRPTLRLTADERPRPRGDDIDVNLRSGPQMREYEAIADRIAADRAGPILDWGCGWGQVSAPAAAARPRRTLVRLPARGRRRGRAAARALPRDRGVHRRREPGRAALRRREFDSGAELRRARARARPGRRRSTSCGGCCGRAARLYVYKLPEPLLVPRVDRQAGSGMYYHGKLPERPRVRPPLGGAAARAPRFAVARVPPHEHAAADADRSGCASARAGGIWAPTVRSPRVPGPQPRCDEPRAGRDRVA